MLYETVVNLSLLNISLANGRYIFRSCSISRYNWFVIYILIYAGWLLPLNWSLCSLRLTSIQLVLITNATTILVIPAADSIIFWRISRTTDLFFIKTMRLCHTIGCTTVDISGISYILVVILVLTRLTDHDRWYFEISEFYTWSTLLLKGVRLGHSICTSSIRGKFKLRILVSMLMGSTVSLAVIWSKGSSDIQVIRILVLLQHAPQMHLCCIDSRPHNRVIFYLLIKLLVLSLFTQMQHLQIFFFWIKLKVQVYRRTWNWTTRKYAVCLLCANDVVSTAFQFCEVQLRIVAAGTRISTTTVLHDPISGVLIMELGLHVLGLRSGILVDPWNTSRWGCINRIIRPKHWWLLLLVRWVVSRLLPTFWC